MEVRYRQAELLVDFEPTVWSDHVDCWRFKGKLSWKYEFAVVKAARVWSVLRAGDDIVPG